MKKVFIVCALCLVVLSCKNDAKTNNDTSNTETTSQTTKYETFSGMFLYLEDENAAVLQTAGSNMYGVVIDEKMKELNKQCSDYKKEDHDMIPVVIRGVRKPNPVENAWKEVIEIKEIVAVQQPDGSGDGTIIIKSKG